MWWNTIFVQPRKEWPILFTRHIFKDMILPKRSVIWRLWFDTWKSITKGFINAWFKFLNFENTRNQGHINALYTGMFSYILIIIAELFIVDCVSHLGVAILWSHDLKSIAFTLSIFLLPTTHILVKYWIWRNISDWVFASYCRIKIYCSMHGLTSE